MEARDGLIEGWKAQGFDNGVIAAMASVPREGFVPGSLAHQAYLDQPLPIGSGQTISQPTTVLIMTQALELGKGMRVLEVGAGSGYQAAVIAELVGVQGRVFSLELSPALAEFSRRNLEKTGYANVEVLLGDGGLGLPRKAPFDRIIITCATPAFPPPLLQQLKEGGIILAPLGGPGAQELLKARKVKGRLEIQSLGSFVFVPMLGRHGQNG